MKSARIMRCLLVLLPPLHAIPASAQVGEDIVVSWVAQIPSTPVPTLGSFGAWFLAILVALLIRRAVGAKPNHMGSLVLAGVLSCSAVGVIWTTQVLSNGSPTVVTIPTDADCSDTHVFSNAEQVTLVNNCANPVRLSYSVAGTSNCALQELSCAGSACAGDSELIPANGGQAAFLGCYATAPTVSLSCADSSLAEDGGTLACSLTLSRTWGQAIDVTVAYSGTATASTDYTGDTAAHTITAGNTSTSWTITGVSDGDNAESDEEIVIEILAVTNGTENGTQSVTIAMPYACIPPGQAIANNTDFGDAITDWFDNSGAEYGDITQWCTAAVTDMNYAFFAKTFNSDIGNWDTSSVTNMNGMFYAASTFNQDISGWDTSSVTDMQSMFKQASVFNKDIGGWITSNVTDMSKMFENAIVFNQDIGYWDTSKVTTMVNMFSDADAFNQNIGNWNTSTVTDMKQMFKCALAFNQNISSWDTSAVTHMGWMFAHYSYCGGQNSFNQNLSGWNVGSVTNCSGFSQDASISWSSSHKPGGACSGQ